MFTVFVLTLLIVLLTRTLVTRLQSQWRSTKIFYAALLVLGIVFLILSVGLVLSSLPATSLSCTQLGSK